MILGVPGHFHLVLGTNQTRNGQKTWWMGGGVLVKHIAFPPHPRHVTPVRKETWECRVERRGITPVKGSRGRPGVT